MTLSELVDQGLADLKELQNENAFAELESHEQNEFQTSSIPHLVVYSQIEVFKAIQKEPNRTRRKVLEALREESNHKPLATIEACVFERLDALALKFPNFESVITHCERRFHLERLGRQRVVVLPKILLSGPPGVGKTRFMEALCETLAIPFFALDMATVSSKAVIAGNASSWSDSKPGFITDSLRQSHFANPVLMLDEIDKSHQRKDFDPLGPFYSLLEEHTAKRFVDEFLGVPFNASKINWVLTANDSTQIPDAIRSRMQEFVIKPPTEAESKAIIRSIYAEMREEKDWGKYFAEALNKNVVAKLANQSPRQVKASLLEAFSNVAARAETEKRPFALKASDVPASSATETKEPAKLKGMGFLASVE